MKKSLLKLWREKIAQDTVEYALLLLLIALAGVASIKKLSNGVKNAYSNTASTITSGGGTTGGTSGGNNTTTTGGSSGGSSGGNNTTGGNNTGGNNGGNN
jgi:Flp pilus assembly pilin Flp